MKELNKNGFLLEMGETKRKGLLLRTEEEEKRGPEEGGGGEFTTKGLRGRFEKISDVKKEEEVKSLHKGRVCQSKKTGFCNTHRSVPPAGKVG